MTNYQQTLHQQALAIAEKHRNCESELIEILQKIDNQKVYLELGYSSLFAYAMKELKLSESVTYNFIQVSRKAKEIPELKQAIALGEITLSNARTVVPILTVENKQDILTMAKTLPKQQLEKEVVRLNPRAAVADKVRYVTPERLELKCGVSEELLKRIKQVQDLVSSQLGKPASLEDALSRMTEDYLTRHDPIERAKRAQKRSPNLSLGQVEEQRQSSPAIVGLSLIAARNTQPVPAKIHHEVIIRDQNQCSHVDKDGCRCQQRRWLQLHHKTPRRVGGENSKENLQLLCSGHHRAEHI